MLYARAYDMNEHRTLHHPLGFDPGDPLIICKDNLPETLRASAAKLQIKGFYVGYLSMIGGRRFDRIIVDISGAHMKHAEFVMFWKWMCDSVLTCIPPANQFKGVTFV